MTLAPLSAGLIFDLISNGAAAFFIAGWNIASACIEYLLLKMIYDEHPDLAHKANLDKYKETEPQWNPWSKILAAAKGWILYLKYPVRNAGFGLACLYMTVLNFDNITYGFCLKQCVPESVLAALVGVSAILGVSGSMTFPILRKQLGTVDYFASLLRVEKYEKIKTPLFCTGNFFRQMATRYHEPTLIWQKISMFLQQSYNRKI